MWKYESEKFVTEQLKNIQHLFYTTDSFEAVQIELKSP